MDTIHMAHAKCHKPMRLVDRYFKRLITDSFDVPRSWLRISEIWHFNVFTCFRNGIFEGAFFGRSYKKYESGYSLQPHTSGVKKTPNLSGANFAVEQGRRDSNKTQCILLTMSKRCTVFHNDLTFLLTISLTTFCGTNRHRILTSIEFRTANISTVQTAIIVAFYFA